MVCQGQLEDGKSLATITIISMVLRVFSGWVWARIIQLRIWIILGFIQIVFEKSVDILLSSVALYPKSRLHNELFTS